MIRWKYLKIVRLPRWLAMKLIYKLLRLCGVSFDDVTVSMRIGYRMKIDFKILFQRRAFFSGQYDDLSLIKLASLVKKDAVILDIGANIGFYCCALAKLLPQSKIYAIEAVGPTFKRLQHNIKINNFEKRVEAVHIALGDRAGTLKMHIDHEGETSNAVGEHTMQECDKERFVSQGGYVQETEMITLDHFASTKAITKCDLIKIDVEGAELLVFTGGTKFIEAHRPIIYGEFNPFWLSRIGKSFEDVYRFFKAIDYNCYGEQNGVIISLKDGVTPGGVEYLFVPKEKEVVK